eukprot:CAMPEP_0174826972 /NCGR_PEP_ID=MMETSP1114-20130205/369_1 /TAXON_ID=312471 /ORGANISM="Neobodo designis, Strain CCAP 1951/1" /LENGTH=352 /DNA_ID=CAMNT_0016060551 /DNA_START=53 /DNA_END=1111 /DNA_ORIENTATION=+
MAAAHKDNSSSGSLKWLAAGALGVGAVAFYLWQRRRQAIAQRAAYPVIEELFVFPIKGCRGFSPKTWELTERGLHYDREWVVLKEGDPTTVITMRNCPKLARVVPTVDAETGHLKITFDGDDAKDAGEPLIVPLAIDDGRLKVNKKHVVEFTLWGAKGSALDEGDVAAKWLSERVGQPVRLYHCFGGRDGGSASDTKREILPPGNEVFGADLSSIMMMSRQTVAKIRAACGVAEVCSERFRANVVVDTGSADAEYTYRRLKTSDGIELTFVKHCERCVVPSVSNDGKMHPACEPTRTLRERFSAPAAHDAAGKAKPLAGINLYHTGTGLLWVGMQLEVVDTGDGPVWTKAEK